MPLEVLLQIHVDQIGRQRADIVDARILRSADARQLQSRGEDAEVGDADDRVAGAEVEKRFCERRNERYRVIRWSHAE